MADHLSPLSSSNLNRNALSTNERSKTYASTTKRAVGLNDTENIPLSSPPPTQQSATICGDRFSPVKSLSPIKARAPHKEIPEQQPRPLTESALRENEGLTRTIKIMEDSAIDPELRRGDDDTMSTMGGTQGFAGMDDTCFSAFSAVPNADMTRFANLGQPPMNGGSRSPTKFREEGPTPRPKSRSTPSRKQDYNDDSYCSPTPRRHKSSHDNDTTNLLMDFTDQYATAHSSHQSPGRTGRLSPSKKYHTQSDLSQFAASRRTPSPTKYPLPPGTPSEARHLANLLDFDLPPAPTPRSIPSITARELESMKSAFQSQISSFKAELLGKEAEVSSLKQAVNDAERRVGEALEEVRNERDAKEGLEGEKADWEKRQQEMQSVLKDVKEEIIRGDREKDALLQRVQEAEHKREEAETRAIEAEGKMEGMRTASPARPSSNSGDPAAAAAATPNANAEVEAAVTKVAKELHGLYKSKHEAKVTALKKSYSDRWEKKIKDLQSKIDELSKENEDLRIGRDATLTGVDPKSLPTTSSTTNTSLSAAAKEAEIEFQTRLDEQAQKLQSLQHELDSTQQDLAASRSVNRDMTVQLESSRVETADLIAATEELMVLSQNATASSSDGPAQPISDFARSLSRSTSGSGLKAPGFSGGGGGESRIGRVGAYGGAVNVNGGAAAGLSRDRSGSSGYGARSGIMSNIERMGRGRAAE